MSVTPTGTASRDRLTSLVRRLAAYATGPASLHRLTRRLPVIAGRGACRHPDGAVRQAASALALFRDHVEHHWSGSCDADGSVGSRRALAVAR